MQHLITRKFALTLIVLLASFASACASEVAVSDASTLQQLSGTYSDPTSYAYGEAFGKRVFTFEDGRWTLDFVLALDPALEQRVFSFRTYGAYEVGAPSATVPGAYETRFTEEAKFLTLHTEDPGLAAAFGFASCGLTPGTERDVSVSGCALWRPVAECGEDHDLLALTEDGGVRFGVRPQDNDMCTPARRPTALTPAVLPAR